LKEGHIGAMPGEDFVEVGRDTNEGIEMAKYFEKAGFDSLHVDAGCYESHFWSHPPNYQKHGCMMDMAQMAKAAVNIPVIGVGRLDKPEVAIQAITEGMMDGVAIGRGLLADPHWCDKVRLGKEEDIRPCVGCYDGCFGNYSKLRHIYCAVNPASGRESIHRIEPTQKAKKIAVVGAGMAGMEAARLAAIKGHKVSLYEKTKSMGGIVGIVAVPDFKKDLAKLAKWHERQIKALDVKIYMETEATADMLKAEKFDAVIIATGSVPVVPPIPGADSDHVMTSVELFGEKKEVGENTVIIGGGLVGCEIALWLHEKGNKSTVVEMLPELMTGSVSIPSQITHMTKGLMELAKIPVMTQTCAKKILENQVIVKDEKNNKYTLKADSVIMAVGMRSVPLSEKMETCADYVYTIGDGLKPRNVLHAIWDAYELIRFL